MACRGGSCNGHEQLTFQRRVRPLAKAMQADADLGFLQLTEIGLGSIQAAQQVPRGWILLIKITQPKLS